MKLMPQRFAVIQWDERIGMELLGAYPPISALQKGVLLQLYMQHEFSGLPGMVSLSNDSVNIASYFSGHETGIYSVVMMSPGEDESMFEAELVQITAQIIEYADFDKLEKELPNFFSILSDIGQN